MDFLSNQPASDMGLSLGCACILRAKAASDVARNVGLASRKVRWRADFQVFINIGLGLMYLVGASSIPSCLNISSGNLPLKFFSSANCALQFLPYHFSSSAAKTNTPKLLPSFLMSECHLCSAKQKNPSM
jgi:hypothetical protein